MCGDKDAGGGGAQGERGGGHNGEGSGGRRWSRRTVSGIQFRVPKLLDPHQPLTVQGGSRATGSWMIRWC
jgi:hypothetical protein